MNGAHLTTARSWAAPDVPVLAPGASTVRVFDSRSQELAPVRVIDGVARLYVCGITPYDATHLGHAATYLAFDTLARALRDSGIPVEYAQNVTDVDDPLLERASRDGVDWQDLATSQTDLFRSDMAALRVIPPQGYIRVSDVIDEIVTAVQHLIDAGYAYPVPTDGAAGDDLYLDLGAVQARTGYRVGAVCHFDAEGIASAFVEFGGDPDRPGKRAALDPLLWRSARPGEPSWPTSFGEGRPGWHVECALIATGFLGAGISVQGGGRDLRFPHHEMSWAHATALTGTDFAASYAHSGLIAYQGEKMSKSLGNLVLVSKLIQEGHDAAAIRLAVLAHHYRSDWEWTPEELTGAEARLTRWRDAAMRTDDRADATEAIAGMRRAIADDLDTPAVLAVVDEWAASDAPARGLLAAVDALLGVRLAYVPLSGSGGASLESSSPDSGSVDSESVDSESVDSGVPDSGSPDSPSAESLPGESSSLAKNRSNSAAIASPVASSESTTSRACSNRST